MGRSEKKSISQIGLKNIENIFEHLNIKSDTNINVLIQSYKLNSFPSHSTIYNLLKSGSATTLTLSQILDLYNSAFNKDATLEDLLEKELSFAIEKKESIYTGFYYCYYLSRGIMSEQIIKYGYLNIQLEKGIHKVNALLGLREKEEEKTIEEIKELLEKNISYDKFMDSSMKWNPTNNHSNYFVGNIHFEKDFYYMILRIPESSNYIFSINNASLFFRRIAINWRDRQLGSVGVLLIDDGAHDLIVRRIILSNIELDDNPELINDLLRNNSQDPSIYDKDDYALYRYLKHHERR